MTVEWINKTDAAIDEKLGLISVRLSFTISPGQSKIATLRHALSFIPDEVKQLGLPLARRDPKERDDGGYDVSFTCEGVFKPEAADGEVFSLDGTTTDERIEAHPELEVLIAKYFPPGTTLRSAINQNGEVVFPVTLNVNGQEIPNPLHGIQTFLLPGMIWTRHRVLSDFPEDLGRQLGCVGNPPVGRMGQRPPRSAPGPEWILARVNADWRGNVWKVSDSWWNSGRGGFPPDVYRYR